MKNLFVYAGLALMMISCMGGASYQASYPLYATFETGNETDTEFWGPDSVFFKSSFSVGDLMFCSKTNESTFGGIGLSMSKSTNFNWYGEFSVYDTVAASNSNVFAVFRNGDILNPEHAIVFPESDYGSCCPVSCMIHNTTTVANWVLNGNARFERGDWFKLTATGYKNGTETGKAEIYLADYREKDSLIVNWTKFDLEPLGDIQYIDFSFSSSRGEGVVPEYFCMDNFLANINISK